MTSKFKKPRSSEPPARPLTGDPIKDGYVLQHDGRTVTLTVHINTLRSVNEVAEAVRSVARGPSGDMVSVIGSESQGATELWAQLYQIAAKAARSQS